MKRCTPALAILALVLILSGGAYAAKDAAKNVFDEARFAPEGSDIFFYLNYAGVNDFFKKNDINPDDLVAIIQGESVSSAEELDIFKKLNSQLQEILVVSQIEQIEKKSGVLAFINVTGNVPDITLLAKGLKPLTIEGMQGYESESNKDLCVFKLDNIFVVGFKGFVTTFLASRKANKPTNLAGFPVFTADAKTRTMHYTVQVSNYIKAKIKTAVKMGAVRGKGLTSNVFINALMNLESVAGSVSLGQEIEIAGNMRSSVQGDGERLMMFSHFVIVGTSLAVSFLDAYADANDKKGLKTTEDQMAKIQATFGRIRTKLSKDGVELAFTSTKEETKEFAVAIKNAIQKEKEAIAKRQAEKEVQEFYALIEMGDVQKVKTASQKFKDLAMKNQNGETPLYIAAEYGQLDIAKFFLERGANVNDVSTEERSTPLHVAATRDHAEMVDFLLGKGASIDTKDNDGNTPLQAALRSSSVLAANKLIAKGANLKNLNAQNETLLHSASSSGDLELLALLIKKGLDVNARNKNMETPLHFAARDNRSDTIRTLVKAKADPNAVSADGSVPLHYAAWGGHLNAVMALVESGASPTMKNNDGKTPGDLARDENYNEIDEYLRGKK
ncbi:MAG: hypothetical protein EPN93_07325 [Spirochaetes bacterium]|nr:MAG: hypothetical protein EPN93_07325 [Spirochaetota bacterium]